MAKILVVEDNLMMRTMMKAGLQRAGHEVVLAEDGERALALAPAGGFDLIVTDVQMPKMGGLALVRALRTSAPDLPILVISGRMEGEGYEALMRPKKFGFDAALEKPFTAERLASKVSEMLSRG